MSTHLYRSRDDRMLAGVAGGLAELWDADPSLVRVIWALLVVFTGGIGARAGSIRRRIVGRLTVLGFDPEDDFEQSADRETDDDLIEGRSGPAIARIVAREDIVIAEATAEIAGGSPAG